MSIFSLHKYSLLLFWALLLIPGIGFALLVSVADSLPFLMPIFLISILPLMYVYEVINAIASFGEYQHVDPVTNVEVLSTLILYGVIVFYIAKLIDRIFYK